MGIAAPGPVLRTWCATGTSMNGLQQYEICIQAMLETTAREMLREYVVQYVRETHGVTPVGVPWLVDPRTIEVVAARQTSRNETKEVDK